MSVVPASRLELLRARRQLARVERGCELLGRKRAALVRELLRLAAPAIDARSAIEEKAQEAYVLLGESLALEGEAALRAIALPVRELHVTLKTGAVWGTPTSEVTERSVIRRTIAARGNAPSLAGPTVTATATRFEELTELLLDAAARESLLRRLGATLARTSRQVHALEHRITPAIEHRIARIRIVLSEREREENLRLKHFLRRRRAARNDG